MFFNLFLKDQRSDTSWFAWMALVALYFNNLYIIDDFDDSLTVKFVPTHDPILAMYERNKMGGPYQKEDIHLKIF